MLKRTNIQMGLFDSLLNISYDTCQCNAQHVKEHLLTHLKSKGINPLDYNQEKGTLKNPPLEIYEYQPFFLLEQKYGQYVLLDGFRRLLWYNTPDHDINVRIYKQSDLTTQEIMKLLVYLNHFKFYGGNGEYYDRGFSLAMKVIFDLNIPKYYTTFDAYLTLTKSKKEYSRERLTPEGEIEMIKERLLNPMFISDMKFVEGLLKSGVILDELFGASMYQFRIKNPNKEFNSQFFLNKIKGNKIISELHKKAAKIYSGYNTHGSEAQKVMNSLIPLYENIFLEMLGGEVKERYAEKLEKTKLVIQTLKKDKGLLKMTGNQNIHLLDDLIKRRMNKKQPLNFRCVIYPQDMVSMTEYMSNKINQELLLPYGIIDAEFNVEEVEKRHGLGQKELEITFNYKGIKYYISHNYSGYYGGGKKYTGASSRLGIPHLNYQIELFVDITKKELQDRIDEHFNRKGVPTK